MSGSARTVLVGLGNPVLGDDAVGLRVAERVRALLAARPLPGVRVATSTRGGFELMEILSGCDRAVVVDCLAIPDARPGRIRELSLQDVAGCARLVGSHDVGLADAVELGRLLDASMPLRVEVIGIEAQITGEMGENLTPPIAALVEPLARQLYARLAEPSSTAAGSIPAEVTAPDPP